MTPYVTVFVRALAADLPAMAAALSEADFKRLARDRFREIVELAPIYDREEIDAALKAFRDLYDW